MGGLFAELRRRKVIRVATAYAVMGWVIIQVVSDMFPALNLPDWTITRVAALLLIGFPVALLLAWAFALTPEGVKKRNFAALDYAGYYLGGTVNSRDFIYIDADYGRLLRGHSDLEEAYAKVGIELFAEE